MQNNVQINKVAWWQDDRTHLRLHDRQELCAYQPKPRSARLNVQSRSDSHADSGPKPGLRGLRLQTPAFHTEIGPHPRKGAQAQYAVDRATAGLIAPDFPDLIGLNECARSFLSADTSLLPFSCLYIYRLRDVEVWKMAATCGYAV